MIRHFTIAAALVLSLGSLARAQDAAKPNTPAEPKQLDLTKKYHVYTTGCRLGHTWVLSTDDLREVSFKVDELRQGQFASREVKVVMGQHDRNELSRTTPIRYEVFTSGLRRCSVDSILVSTTPPDLSQPKNPAAAANLARQFTVVSYR